MKAIANSEKYTDQALSRFEELLLCLLNGTETTMVPSSRLEKILIALVNGEEAPPTISSSTFKTDTLAKIIVPAGCGDTYKAATNWAAFADYIEEASAE